MAQQLVETASSLVGNRTVNVMDTEGVIIASTEHSRIGTFHKGAADAIRTGKPVAIEKSEVFRYPGAREGYNLPLFSHGRLIGVVGMYGNPSEVYETAQLLGAYTIQFFEQDAAWQQQAIENELRSDLIHMFLTLDDARYGELEPLLQALHIHMEFPARVFLIGLSDGTDSIRGMHLLSPLIAQLKAQCFLLPETDVYGVRDSRVFILKFCCAGQESLQLERLRSLVFNDREESPFRISAGSVCAGRSEIRRSYQEALALHISGSAPVLDFLDAGCRFDYLMQQSARSFAPYVAQMCAGLSAAFSEPELQSLLDTADCYYAERCSVTQASNKLHVHKNTLQYRMRLLFDALGIAELPPFQREYLLRLCILHRAHPAASADEPQQ